VDIFSIQKEVLKSVKMKHLNLYYLTIIAPPLLLIFALDLSSELFVFALLSYAFIYRPLVDTWRLLSVHPEISRKELAVSLIPIYGHSRYFKTLYLPKKTTQPKTNNR
jgi:hypothetical protein